MSLPLFAILELDFVTLLDQWLAKVNDSLIGLVAKKVWKIGSPPQSLPPVNAPVWLIAETLASAGEDIVYYIYGELLSINKLKTWYSVFP